VFTVQALKNLSSIKCTGLVRKIVVDISKTWFRCTGSAADKRTEINDKLLRNWSSTISFNCWLTNNSHTYILTLSIYILSHTYWNCI